MMMKIVASALRNESRKKREDAETEVTAPVKKKPRKTRRIRLVSLYLYGLIFTIIYGRI